MTLAGVSYACFLLFLWPRFLAATIYDGRRNLPKVRNAIGKLRKRLKVLAEIARNEGQRQEDDRDHSQLLHALVLVRRDGVEDEVNEVVGAALDLLHGFRDDDAVIEDVAEVRVRERRDDDARGRVTELARRNVGTQVGRVIAQDVDHIVDRVQKPSFGEAW
ncbi:hypothetical protein HYQ46_000125 [Verticillium longisporum]|nr:hypothetical protein HYQ46_000125 [Verticillium longisporum]